MNRRNILAFAALGVASARAVAQQAKKTPRIGYLFIGSFALRPQVQGFFQGLRELGYVEGQNIIVERREAEGKYERLPQLAKELVTLGPELIVAHTTPGALAMQKATTSIPIVTQFLSDPVGSGLTNSLARPSGNVTGCSNNARELTRKRMQLLKEIMPSASRVAVLWNSLNPSSIPQAEEAHASASALGMQVEPLEFKGTEGLQAVLKRTVRAHALMVITEPVLTDQRAAIARFAIAQRMGAFGLFPEEAEAGMLGAYGESLWNGFHRSARYVDKILRGAKPADLPFEDPTTYDLTINLKTAKAIGLSIPQLMLLRATQVIE